MIGFLPHEGLKSGAVFHRRIEYPTLNVANRGMTSKIAKHPNTANEL